MESSTCVDLSIIRNDCLAIEKKMLGLLTGSRLFFENALQYLRGKRSTKSNFAITDTEAIPHFVEQIMDTLDKDEDLDQLQTVVAELKPKRSFLFDTLEIYLTSAVEEQDKRAAKAIHHEYLEKVVWKLCASEYELAQKSAGRIARNITNVTYEDKMGYAYVGLTKAAHKFDFDKGVQFNTYAAWWIWESILDGCNTEMYFLKIKSPMQQRYIKFLSSMRKKDGKQHEHLTKEELNEIYSSCNVASVYLDDGTDISDFIVSDLSQEKFYSSNPEFLLRVKTQNERMQEIVNTKLTTRERNLLTSYHGVFEHRKKSIKQICKINKISEEQLEEQLELIHYKIRVLLE